MAYVSPAAYAPSAYGRHADPYYGAPRVAPAYAHAPVHRVGYSEPVRRNLDPDPYDPRRNVDHLYDPDYPIAGRPHDEPLPLYEPELRGRPLLPKLYGTRISANCMGPWLLLKEAGIPFEFVEVDIADGDNRTAEFLAMNPMGQVPTYAETDGTVIWESNAIMRFICDKHIVPSHLYPTYVFSPLHV